MTKVTCDGCGKFPFVPDKPVTAPIEAECPLCHHIQKIEPESQAAPAPTTKKRGE